MYLCAPRPDPTKNVATGGVVQKYMTVKTQSDGGKDTIIIIHRKQHTDLKGIVAHNYLDPPLFDMQLVSSGSLSQVETYSHFGKDSLFVRHLHKMGFPQKTNRF